METQQQNAKPRKVAYSITERNGRSFWTRIGAAFTNKDGSITVKLEATPVSGQLQIRDWEPRDDTPSAGAGPGPRTSRAKDDVLAELPF